MEKQKSIFKTRLEEYIFSQVGGVLKKPYKAISYPFIDPGAGYEGNLWDWDSYWMAFAIRRMSEIYSREQMSKAGMEKAENHAKGCVKNFLEAQCTDGYTPIMMTGDGSFCDFFVAEHKKGTPVNQMKPFLCQAIWNACQFSGDYTWFDREKVLKYLDYYEKNQKDEKTGLFFWQDDIMIGIDNNPTVFFRPPRTCADIYINSFMYMEYKAMAELLHRLGDDRAKAVAQRREDLKKSINEYMWDQRDGIYYSQDISRHRTDLKAGSFTFHENLEPTWSCLPMRIRFWGCFLPLYAEIADEDQFERMLAHLKDDAIMAQYGIRTCAADERMYNLEKTSNPSNWLGAVWTISNYCVWKGLKNYGERTISEQLRQATINLLGQNLLEKGALFESYQPDSGEPNLNPGFLSWNLLVLDMLNVE